MNNIYLAILKAADFCLARKRIIFPFGAFLILIALSWIALSVLQNFPNSADEYCYLYQAKTFLKGRFWNAPHPLQDSFLFFWIFHIKDKLVTHYMPGWAIVLAAFMKLGIPAWLSNPTLGVLFLGVQFRLGCRIFNERAAFLSVLIMLFSSFFLLNAASYFSHVLSALLIMLFFLKCFEYVDNQKLSDAFLTGVFFGMAFLTRLTLFLCSLPLIIWVLRQRISRWAILYFIAGTLPFIVFLLAYQFCITGKFLSSPLFETNQNLHVWKIDLASFYMTHAQLKSFIYWTPAFLILVYFVSLLNFAKNSRKTIIGLSFLCLVFGHAFYQADPGNQYGPRYYFEGYPFLVLLASAYLFKEEEFSQKSFISKCLFFLFLISIVFSIPLTYQHFMIEKQVVWERREPFRLVERNHIKNAIIFLGTGSGALRPMSIGDLTRNDIDFTNDVLYVWYRGKEDAALKAFYPQKSYYLYFYDPARKRGFLAKY